MKQIITLTIAIPAYNEQENIAWLLKSILKQKLPNITIQKILVISDGSTDKTFQKVVQIMKKNKKIIFVNHKKRLGKVARLNEIFRYNTSDYLIVLDADIHLASEKCLIHMVEEMKMYPTVTMLAAHQIPTLAKSFTARVIYAAYKVWDDTRLAVPDRVHIQNFYGAATIYRKSFVKKLHIPSAITDERGYIYLKAIEHGNFRYSLSASIYYRPVETLHDLWKLGDRSFEKNQVVLANMFGEKVFKEYRIPFIYKIKSILSNLINSPVLTTLGLILNILIRILPMHDRLYSKGMWEPSLSTKRAIKL